jgi:haloacetate dehalogenase
MIVARALPIEWRWDTDVVERLAVLDIIPTSEALRRADFRFHMTFWPWSLLAQPGPLPERLLSADPAAVVDDALANWGSDAGAFPPEVRTAYVQALSTIEAVHAICEEYRAAVTIDRDMDDQDHRAGRRIQCPTLVLWSKGSALDRWYDSDGGVMGESGNDGQPMYEAVPSKEVIFSPSKTLPQ